MCLLDMVHCPDLDQEEKDPVVQQPLYLITGKNEIGTFLFR